LELFATLLCVMLLWPLSLPPERGTAAILGFSAATDNQSNAYVLDRLMSTKWPLGPVLCELAAQLRKRRAQMRLSWIPRGENQPADDLTNLKFDQFCMEKRVHVDVRQLEFLLLPTLLAEGPGAPGRQVGAVRPSGVWPIQVAAARAGRATAPLQVSVVSKPPLAESSKGADGSASG
jgi:hypothetical protein